MQSIDLIRDNLTKSRDRVLARVEEMREHSVVFPTRNGGSHTLWVLGHLAYIEALVVRGFMRSEMGHTAPIRRALFDRHPRLQCPVREIVEHRVRQPPHDRDPVLAIVMQSFRPCACNEEAAATTPAALRKSRRSIRLVARLFET
jgi:hypothetical protein